MQAEPRTNEGGIPPPLLLTTHAPATQPMPNPSQPNEKVAGYSLALVVYFRSWGRKTSSIVFSEGFVCFLSRLLIAGSISKKEELLCSTIERGNAVPRPCESNCRGLITNFDSSRTGHHFFFSEDGFVSNGWAWLGSPDLARDGDEQSFMVNNFCGRSTAASSTCQKNLAISPDTGGH